MAQQVCALQFLRQYVARQLSTEDIFVYLFNHCAGNKGLAGLLANPVLSTSVAGLATAATGFAAVEVRELTVMSQSPRMSSRLGCGGFNSHWISAWTTALHDGNRTHISSCSACCCGSGAGRSCILSTRQYWCGHKDCNGCHKVKQIMASANLLYPSVP